MLCIPRQLTFILLLGASLSLSSQQIKPPDTPAVLDITHPSEHFPEKWYPRIGDGTDILPAPVLDRAYTAIVESITPDPTSPGQAPRHVILGLQMRDPRGRTRSESEDGGMTIERKTLKTKLVTVYDPVAHCQFHWTEFVERVEMPPEERVAIVNCGPQTLRYQAFNAFASILESSVDGTTTRGDTETTTEHLPPLQFDGLVIQRLRVSNQRTDEHSVTKTWTAETWYSPELKEIVRLGTIEQGYSGLIEIHRGNPDPNLFYPPDSYRIEQRPR